MNLSDCHIVNNVLGVRESVLANLFVKLNTLSHLHCTIKCEEGLFSICYVGLYILNVYFPKSGSTKADEI